jgi:hypothetical protein
MKLNRRIAGAMVTATLSNAKQSDWRRAGWNLGAAQIKALHSAWGTALI